MRDLTQLQKQLCDILQNGLPICERPFAEIAEDLGVNQQEVLKQIGELKNFGIIRRFRAVINPRALGKSSTLVTAHIPHDRIEEIAEFVNSLPGVSHNYLRGNFYNLWFTLQEQTISEIEQILSNLKEHFGIDFHSLPVVRTFKLNVRFAINNDNQNFANRIIPRPQEETVELNYDEKAVLSNLQNELEITAEPFAFLTDEDLEIEDVLRIIRKMINKGVIRRIAAVVDYRRLGFTANVLLACQVSQENIIDTGEKLAYSEMVSHCYERRTFEDWPYNLFAMMHSTSIDEIQKFVDDFTKAEKINSYQLLPTVAELKKEPVKYNLI